MSCIWQAAYAAANLVEVSYKAGVIFSYKFVIDRWSGPSKVNEVPSGTEVSRVIRRQGR